MLTVKELIKRCDKERLTAEYIKLIDLPIEKYDRFKVYFGAFIDQLIDKEYIVSDNDIVINADCFSLDMENHYVDSSVYYIDEIKRKLNYDFETGEYKTPGSSDNGSSNKISISGRDIFTDR